MEANKIKWVVKFVQKRILMRPYNNTRESNDNTKYSFRYQLFNFVQTSRKSCLNIMTDSFSLQLYIALKLIEHWQVYIGFQSGQSPVNVVNS